ncbi:MAG: hypothetical protein QGG67_07790 [Gammaproteobacteria bacterium]|nr:hypothetical protein [Gammaproteobacteria bacterium]
MSEQPIFWLGGAPGQSKDKGFVVPEAERYEPALRDACEACGFQVDDYVAAQGGFGGWLVHLVRGTSRYRVFWSGKTNQLKFESAHSGGGWNEAGVTDIEDAGLPAFVEAVKALLSDRNGRDKVDG